MVAFQRFHGISNRNRWFGERQWDDALRRRLRAAAPVDANAACVAYAADERARAALPTMNVSRGDVDVLFAPDEGSWD